MAQPVTPEITPALPASPSKLRQKKTTWRSFSRRVIKLKQKVKKPLFRIKSSHKVNPLQRLLHWLRWCMVLIGVTIVLLLTPLAASLLKPQLLAQDVIKPTQSHDLKSASLFPSAQGTFDYPRLGLHLPANQAQAQNPLDTADWKAISEVLQKGIGFVYKGDFAKAPTVYLIGHSSDYNLLNPYAYAFAPLGQAKIGDSMTLTYQGNTYIYTISNKKILNPLDTHSFYELEKSPNHTQRLLLVTCWPLMTTQSRLVVVAERPL